MRKIIYGITAGLLFTLGVQAQQKKVCLQPEGDSQPASCSDLPPAHMVPAYGFKGDNIGETLEQFRENNRRVLEERTLGTVDSKGQMVYASYIHTYPICSGDITEMPQPQDDTGLYPVGSKQWTKAITEYNSEMSTYLNRDATGETVDLWKANSGGSDIFCYAQPNGETSLASGPVTVFYQFKNNQLDLIHILFENRDYSSVRDAVVAKYGSPTNTKTDSYENKMGASFQGEIAIWKRSDSAIVLTQILESNLDGGLIEIFNPATRKAINDKLKEQSNSDF